MNIVTDGRGLPLPPVGQPTTVVHREERLINYRSHLFSVGVADFPTDFYCPLICSVYGRLYGPEASNFAASFRELGKHQEAHHFRGRLPLLVIPG